MNEPSLPGSAPPPQQICHRAQMQARHIAHITTQTSDVAGGHTASSRRCTIAIEVDKSPENTGPKTATGSPLIAAASRLSGHEIPGRTLG